MIRLPDHVSKVDKMARIDEIVDALHLRDCLDTSKMVFVLVLHIFVGKCIGFTYVFNKKKLWLYFILFFLLLSYMKWLISSNW